LRNTTDKTTARPRRNPGLLGQRLFHRFIQPESNEPFLIQFAEYPVPFPRIGDLIGALAVFLVLPSIRVVAQS
jgi:hypothetical protein